MFYLLKGLKTQEEKAKLMEKSPRLNFPVPPAALAHTHQSKVLSNQSAFFFPPFKYFSGWQKRHQASALSHLQVNEMSPQPAVIVQICTSNSKAENGCNTLNKAGNCSLFSLKDILLELGGWIDSSGKEARM